MQPNRENPLAVQAVQSGEPAACPSFKKQPPFDRTDGAFALITLLLGYLFLRLVSLIDAGAGVPVFTLCYMVLVLSYARCTARVPARGSIGWGIFLAAFSLLFLKGISGSLQFPALCFLSAGAAYWTMTVFDARIGKALDSWVLGDFQNALLRLPFCGFGALVHCAGIFFRKGTAQKRNPPSAVSGTQKDAQKEEKDAGDLSAVGEAEKQKRARCTAVVLGILLTLLLLPPVLLLLAAADQRFAQVVDFMAEQIMLSPEVLLRIFFSLPVSFYLFGLFSGARHHLYLGADAAERRHREEKRKRIGLAAAAIPSAVLLAVYLLFLAVQLPYFFSAFAGLLPDGMTYAEYARRGFFELIAVTVINLGLLLFAKRQTQVGTRGRKIISALLCGATLLLLCTAARKLMLYIEIFGLTRKRIWAGWAMVLIAAAVLLFLADEFHPLPLMRWISLLFCGWFFALCAVNTEPLTLRYNYAQWKAGNIENMDVWEGEAIFAAPVLYEIFYDTQDPLVREECALRLQTAKYDLQQKIEQPLTAFTLAGLQTADTVTRAQQENILYFSAQEEAAALQDF